VIETALSTGPVTVAGSGRTGADLLGWSALPLLGRWAPETGRWLFLYGPSEAWVSAGPLPEAQFVPVTLPCQAIWPFEDGTLGGVVIDGDAVVRDIGAAPLEQLLTEATRVTSHHGNVLVACTHRRVPRQLRAWREYGRQSAGTWRRAAARAGVATRTVGSLRLDGQCITDLTLSSGHTCSSPAAREADRLVLQISAVRHVDPVVVDGMIAEVAREIGIVLTVDRIAVRKIGKTAVFLSGSDGRRYIMRIARSPIALARGRRNFDTLASLHRSMLPNSVRSRVPVAILHGTHAGYTIFLETCLEGTSGPVAASQRTTAGWARDAVEFVTALHTGTSRMVTVDAIRVTSLVRDPVARIASACGQAEVDEVLRRVEATCERALVGVTLPLVQTQGDFTESNCLFSSEGALTAVVDWEVAVPDGLPLLDLLQFMPVPPEPGPQRRWQHFDACLAFLQEPARLAVDPIMGPYMRTLGVPAGSGPALILLQWITHVSDRIEARSDDERWLRMRVWQPLESLGRTLRD